MRDFLEEALEQERDENEDMEREIPFEFHSAGGKALGASFVQKRPPDPQKASGGESFDSLSPGTPSIKLGRIEAASFQRHIYLCPTMGRAGAGQIEAPGVKTIEPTLVHPVLTLGLSWRAREAILL